LGHQTCKNRRPYNLHCVGADIKPCSVSQSINQSMRMTNSQLYEVYRTNSRLHCKLLDVVIATAYGINWTKLLK